MTVARAPKTNPPERLSELERKRIRKWMGDKYPQYLPEARLLWENCRDWHLKYGVQCSSWEAAFRMWVRKQPEIDARGGRRAQPGSPELPKQPRAPGRAELTLLKDVLKD